MALFYHQSVFDRLSNVRPSAKADVIEDRCCRVSDRAVCTALLGLAASYRLRVESCITRRYQSCPCQSLLRDMQRLTSRSY